MTTKDVHNPKATLDDHIKLVHPDYTYCVICKSYTPQKFDDHIKQRHPDYTYCVICKSYTPQKLDDHIKQRHSK